MCEDLLSVELWKYYAETYKIHKEKKGVETENMIP